MDGREINRSFLRIGSTKAGFFAGFREQFDQRHLSLPINVVRIERDHTDC